jgi:hypothetical protein
MDSAGANNISSGSVENERRIRVAMKELSNTSLTQTSQQLELKSVRHILGLVTQAIRSQHAENHRTRDRLALSAEVQARLLRENRAIREDNERTRILIDTMNDNHMGLSLELERHREALGCVRAGLEQVNAGIAEEQRRARGEAEARRNAEAGMAVRTDLAVDAVAAMVCASLAGSPILAPIVALLRLATPRWAGQAFPGAVVRTIAFTVMITKLRGAAVGLGVHRGTPVEVYVRLIVKAIKERSL